MKGKGKGNNQKPSRLPIFEHEEEIVESVRVTDVTMVVGATGCGKSTQVPQILLKEREGRVIVAQPRRLVVKSLARRVSEERGYETFDQGDVGFHIGGEESPNASKAKILFVTFGILLKMLAGGNMTDYHTIILDEIHERQMHFDASLGLLTQRLTLNYAAGNSHRLVLMSATPDADVMREHFAQFSLTTSLVQITSVSIHKIITYHLEDMVGKFSMTQKELAQVLQPPDEDSHAKLTPARRAFMVRLVVHLHQSTPLSAGILIFVSGISLISEIAGMLAEHLDASKKKFEILRVHSSFPMEEQAKAVERMKGRRKIVLSTNISESSLTIPDLSIVIDSTFQKRVIFDQEKRLYVLEETLAPKSTLIQRAGRVGRVRGGACYRLITLEEYKKRSEWSIPEIKNSPLDGLYLTLLKNGIQNVLDFVIDRPPPQNVEETITHLHSLGALENNDGNLRITPLGSILETMPLEPKYAMLVYLGFVFGVLEEAIVAAFILATKNPIISTIQRQMACFLQKIRFSASSSSDVVAGVRAYFYWKEQRELLHLQGDEEVKWCAKNMLSLFTLRELQASVIHVKSKLSALKMCPSPTLEEFKLLKERNEEPFAEAELEEEDEFEEDLEDFSGEDIGPSPYIKVVDPNAGVHHQISLTWDPVVLRKEVTIFNLIVAITVTFHKQTYPVRPSQEISSSAELFFRTPPSTSLAQEIIQQISRFVPNPSITLDRIGQNGLRICSGSLTQIPPALSGFNELQRSKAVLILASKLRDLGSQQITKASLSDESYIHGTPSPEISSFLDLFKYADFLSAKPFQDQSVMVDKMSVNSPLLVGEPSYIVAGQEKVIGDKRRPKTILFETTLINKSTFEMAKCLASSNPPEDQQLDKIWKKIWLEAPRRLLNPFSNQL